MRTEALSYLQEGVALGRPLTSVCSESHQASGAQIGCLLDLSPADSSEKGLRPGTKGRITDLTTRATSVEKLMGLEIYIYILFK